ncbi:Cyclin N-terminal domain-containing protein [Mycena kentingensis (nom. inval.)]|nr:Cyclin N-terminal domain-containing protein [Mycena kentingensis (nom. inval.)]
MIARALRVLSSRSHLVHSTPCLAACPHRKRPLLAPYDPPGACQSLKRRHVIRQCSDYVLDSVGETVDFAIGRSHSESRGRSAARSSPYLTPFTTFATTVLTRAEVTPATVFASLVYVARSRSHLSIALEEWALERVFLGALIVAAKYAKDSTLKNVHWALCTGVLGKRDVGRIQREFLNVLNWELAIRETYLLAHHQALAEAAFPSPVRTHKKRMSAFLAVSSHHTRQASATSITLPDLEPSSPASASSSLGSFLPAHTRAVSRACHPRGGVRQRADGRRAPARKERQVQRSAAVLPHPARAPIHV